MVGWPWRRWSLSRSAWLQPMRMHAQALGGAGTLMGTVKDATGGVQVGATVSLSNPVAGFKREATTDQAGQFVFRNLPPNPYHLAIAMANFQTLVKDVDVSSAVPVDLGSLTLALGAASTSVEVDATNLVENTPLAHTDIDQSVVSKLPVEAQSGLNQAITLAAPGIVADSNGFFHPMGDHAQTQFAIDNQPVTDQQSRLYSNQISPAAVQSMEVITGVAPAEYGDKSSLVVQITTKSGLDQAKTAVDFSTSFGSFNTPTGDLNVGFGSHTAGNFLSYTGLRSDRYLDSPEFAAQNDTGHSNSLFDRFDLRSATEGALHVNVQAAQSAFQIPNTLDQQAAGQDQRQQITSLNLAPGYSRVMANSVLTATGFVRQDRVVYSPSTDAFADTPATISQNRRLTNTGGKVDFQLLKGVQNIKMGASASATALKENFNLGLTDPTFNSPCVDGDGNPSSNTALTGTAQCAGANLVANTGFVPGLAPFDLTRGGGLFTFNGAATIREQAAYVEDEVKAGPATFNLGLRVDRYDGLTEQTALEPRLALALQSKATNTVFRASYGRTMETPYNENLLLSSSTGANGLADSGFGPQAVDPLKPGIRNEFEVGAQQALGRWLVADVGYFQKHTTNGYDFDVLFNTPIVFPISWDHSDLSGITGRLTLVEHHGFTAFMVLGHNVARFFNPENGGLLFDSPLPSGAFRIDHDQKFQQTTNLQYTFDKVHGAWIGFTWRYDSGLVAGAVTDYATALSLDGDQQAAIGLFCGSTFATPSAPLTSCASSDRGATRVVIPADGTENDDTNPPRIAPRSLFDLGLGVDNVFRSTHTKVKVRLGIVNLGNTIALYNFLSTFSGTHFVTPRAISATVGITF